MVPKADRDLRIRSAVRRLLSGSTEQHDLAILCLWLRDRTPTGSLPREIGDFIAHSEEREKGPTFQAVSDFYWMWDGAQRYFKRHPDGQRTNTELFKRQMSAVVRRISELKPQEHIGMHPEAVRQRIDRIVSLAKFDNAAGTYFDPPLNQKDTLVYDFASRTILSTAVVKAHSLYLEYLDAMIAAQVLEKNEAEGWRNVVPFFSAYLISTMHLTRIRMEDGVPAVLQLVLGTNGKLGVSISFEVGDDNLSTMVFPSDLDTMTWCKPELMQYRSVSVAHGVDWAPWVEHRIPIPAIELSSDGKIAICLTDLDLILF